MFRRRGHSAAPPLPPALRPPPRLTPCEPHCRSPATGRIRPRPAEGARRKGCARVDCRRSGARPQSPPPCRSSPPVDRSDEASRPPLPRPLPATGWSPRGSHTGPAELPAGRTSTTSLIFFLLSHGILLEAGSLMRSRQAWLGTRASKFDRRVWIEPSRSIEHWGCATPTVASPPPRGSRRPAHRKWPSERWSTTAPSSCTASGARVGSRRRRPRAPLRTPKSRRPFRPLVRVGSATPSRTNVPGVLVRAGITALNVRQLMGRDTRIAGCAPFLFRVRSLFAMGPLAYRPVSPWT